MILRNSTVYCYGPVCSKFLIMLLNYEKIFQKFIRNVTLQNFCELIPILNKKNSYYLRSVFTMMIFPIRTIFANKSLESLTAPQNDFGNGLIIFVTNYKKLQITEKMMLL